MATVNLLVIGYPENQLTKFKGCRCYFQGNGRKGEGKGKREGERKGRRGMGRKGKGEVALWRLGDKRPCSGYLLILAGFGFTMAVAPRVRYAGCRPL